MVNGRFDRDVLVAWAWDAGERAAKTGAQVLLAAMGASLTLNGVDWVSAIFMTVYAMLASVLTSIVSFNSAQPGTASLVATGPLGKHHKIGSP